jgi:hypothetical protein
MQVAVVVAVVVAAVVVAGARVVGQWARCPAGFHFFSL